MMQGRHAPLLWRGITLAVGLLIVKVTGSVLLGYVDYFPPNFRNDFLWGRQPYFFGAYQWAFYTHLISGPIALLLGLFLLSERSRRRWPTAHRRLGRVQVLNILIGVTPSGLWMAFFAQAGVIAAASFTLLALATALTAVLGWRSAVRRRFTEHRRWMQRCYLLLCSAVVIRVIGGAGTVLGVAAEWFNPFNAWFCWLAPLILFELSSGARLRQSSVH